MVKKSVMAVGGGVVVLALAAVFVLRGGPGQAAGVLPYDDPDAVAAGQKIYEAQCASCHGTDLSGQEGWKSVGADGLRPAPPHDETGHTWHHPDALLFALTKQGVAEVVGDGYRSGMPGFGDVLTDTEILQALAYIKSTWPAQVIEVHNDINAKAGSN